MDIKISNESKLCTQCNIFFGTASSQWLCSSCYKTKNQANSLKAIVESQAKVIYPTVESQRSIEDRLQKRDKGRCFKCNKKVGLLGVQCKCDYVFCNQHRLPEDHECNIDYKQIGKQKLRKNNQIVSRGKIEQI